MLQAGATDGGCILNGVGIPTYGMLTRSSWAPIIGGIHVRQ